MDAKKQYKDMGSKHGKPESSFAYLLDKALQVAGAKRPACHGGDLEGNSARCVMENSDKLFEQVKIAAKNSRDNNSNLSQTEADNILDRCRLLFTLLGTCFSMLRQVLPTDEDLELLSG